MRPQNCSRVFVIELFEPGKTLVDVHIVNEKVNGTINGYSQPDKEHPPLWGEGAEQEQGDTRGCKDQKKQVVFFEKPALLEMGFVVVFVPFPEEAVHHILVGEPGHEFHGQSSGKGY
jgi:hypothetical protein